MPARCGSRWCRAGVRTPGCRSAGCRPRPCSALPRRGGRPGRSGATAAAACANRATHEGAPSGYGGRRYDPRGGSLGDEIHTANGTTAVTAARVALVAQTVFLLLLATLHLLEPELDPSWRLISEYTLGRFGALMVFAFLLSALGCVGLVIAVAPLTRSRTGVTGRILLLISAAGMLIAALFPTDPITADMAELSPSGQLHRFGALLAILSFAPAAELLSRSLARQREWAAVRGALRWMVALVWFGLLAFAGSMALMFRGSFGEEVLVGWPHRFLMLANSAWLLVVARWLLTRGRA